MQRGNYCFRSPDDPINDKSDIWSWAAMILSIFAGYDNEIMNNFTKEELQDIIESVFINKNNEIDNFFKSILP